MGEEADDIEYRQRLREDVEELIAPYRHDDKKKAPCSAAELIVMATVCGNVSWNLAGWRSWNWPECRERQEIAKRRIVVWIGSSFTFYAARMIEQYAEAVEVDVHRPKFVSMVLDKFQKAFDQHGIPLNGKPSQARIFLSRWLEPGKRRGTFNFFGLPAERRDRMYEELLLYPSNPGLRIRRDTTYKCPRNHTILEVGDDIDEDIPITWQNWQRCHGTYPESFQWKKVESPKHTLRFLEVSKQVFQEAIPIYFGLNSFSFHILGELVEVLSRLSPERLGCLRNIHVKLRWICRAQCCHFGRRKLEKTSWKKLAAIGPHLSLDKLELEIPYDLSEVRDKSSDPSVIRVKRLEHLFPIATRAKVLEVYEEGGVDTEDGEDHVKCLKEFFFEETGRGKTRSEPIDNTLERTD